ncbi:MAG: cytochrome P450, partial [Anaerolineae bacterium]|nr:cytochrome P450 [Anaerolineae bacterium]
MTEDGRKAEGGRQKAEGGAATEDGGARAEGKPLPVATGEVGLQVLKGLARDRSLLTALTLMNRYVGRAFQITMPRFRPAVFVGPAPSRQILVTERSKFLWRTESDPVTRLLRQGILVVDGDLHDTLRGQMDPPLHRKHVLAHLAAFWQATDQVTTRWRDGETRDMLVEMRRAALLILMGTLFRVDFAPDMDRLWHAVLGVIEYISPGLWIMWPGMPRPKYHRALREMDDYLYSIIARRRAEWLTAGGEVEPSDLLGQLIATPGMSDDLIRDQLLTMLIAGHDTSTALLAWTLTLLGQHPDALARARVETDAVLGPSDAPPTLDQLERLDYLDRVVKETLRLYPPIHVGNRRAACDVTVAGYHVPANTRVMYSIYLAHRDPDHWPDPDRFDPDRFSPANDRRAPFAYIPFGGGPRICIGAAFAQIEVKV